MKRFYSSQEPEPFHPSGLNDCVRSLYDRQEIAGALGESHVRPQAHLTDRSEALGKLRIPTLVLHGQEDYLVDRLGGIQTAECIRDSKLVLLPQMGHMIFNSAIKRRFEDEIIAFVSCRV